MTPKYERTISQENKYTREDFKEALKLACDNLIYMQADFLTEEYFLKTAKEEK